MESCPFSPLGVSALVRAKVFAVSVELFLAFGHRIGLLLIAPVGICVEVMVNLFGSAQGSVLSSISVNL